jgi:hypothetical protein
MLREAFEKRQVSDDESLPVFRREDVERMQKQAERFLEAGERYLAGLAEDSGWPSRSG